MRISDWSSDVCSSDLTSRIRPCSLAARAPSSQTVSTNLTSRPRPLLWLQSTQGLSPTVTYGKQTPGGGPSNTPLTALARGACARIAATAAACTAITRSEEHTSELQSLMRISYAVFCLKKTKKHTHATTYMHLTQTLTTHN